MPVTPKFQLTQTSTHITISIRAQYARLETAEAYVDEKSFLFSAAPYFLRLYFQEKLVVNEDPRCSFDSDKNLYSFEVQKEVEGVDFKNLNSVGSLLANPESAAEEAKFTGISVLGEEDDAVESGEEEEEEDGKNDTGISESLSSVLDAQNSKPQISYIYGHIKSLFFNEVHTLFQLKSTETSQTDRIRLSEDICRVDFDQNHYYSDLKGDEDEDLHTVTGLPKMKKIISAKLPQSKLKSEYTDAEFELVQKLPRRKPLLTKNDKKICTAQFIEILYGVCYVNRSLEFNSDDLEFDPACYTVRRLSRGLSWLVIDSDIHKTVKSLLQRTLSYSLRRNFELSKMVLQDMVGILNSGVVPAVRCLLESVQWCNYSEAKIISDCFIVPVVLWIQTRDDSWLKTLGERVEKSGNSICLDDLGFEIESFSEMEDTSDESEESGDSEESSEDSENGEEEEEEEMDYDEILGQIEKYKLYLEEQEKAGAAENSTRLIQEMDDLNI